MKLTGKAKEDFLKWNYNDDFGYIDIEPTSLVVHFENLDENLRNTIIIEWLDSVGIYVTVNYNFIQAKFTNSVKDKDTILYRGGLYSTRQEATEKAIEQANILYNELNR